MILGGSLVGSLGKIPLVKPLGGIPGGYMREIPGGRASLGRSLGRSLGGDPWAYPRGVPKGLSPQGGTLGVRRLGAGPRGERDGNEARGMGAGPKGWETE